MSEAPSSPRRRRAQPARAVRTRLRVEQLESRDVPSTFNLTPLVPVSGTSPFLDCPLAANDPAFGLSTETEPYVAVDPTNPNHLVGAWIQDFARGIVSAVSFNGGNTWQSVVIPGATACAGGIYPFAEDPWVSFAPNGDVYLSLRGLDFAKNTPSGILVSKSTDGGLTWGAPTTIVTGNNGNDSHDNGSVTADPTNSQFAYATWTRLGSAGAVTMFSRTTDGGLTWEPARAIFDSGSNNMNQGHQIVVLPDGTLVTFFTQMVKTGDTGGIEHFDLNLSLIRSSDQGRTWLPEKKTPIQVADILPPNDTLTIPGGVGMANPDGGLGIVAAYWFFDVAVDPGSGNLYAVWQDTRFGNSQYPSITFSMSTDGGFTWSAPVRVNQTPDTIPVGNRQAFLPSIAVNQDGVVAVTYYDFRNNTPAPGLPTDYWMVHAHPSDGLTNPANWVSENRLTPASFNIENAPTGPGAYFLGDYEGLVAQGKNFGAFFSMPVKTDLSSIFYRDPPPAESPEEMRAHAPHSEFRDVSSRHGIDVRTADPGGRTPGPASGHTIWLEANAAAWGWSVEPTPRHDSKVTTPGTAKTREDYIAKTGTLTFAPGETTKSITIEVKGDSKREADEYFYLDLFGNSGNSLFTKSRGTGTILDDD